jgi:hypothetical protein
VVCLNGDVVDGARDLPGRNHTLNMEAL